MGTDIYLEWKGQGKDEWKQQVETGNGYLRASIHMTNENALLRMLFPPQYWDSNSKEPYDFKGNWHIMLKLCGEYCAAVLQSRDLEVQGSQAESIKQRQKIEEALKNLGAKFVCGKPPEGLDGFRFAVSWANWLIEFFELGMKKQAEGLEPYPLISW